MGRERGLHQVLVTVYHYERFPLRHMQCTSLYSHTECCPYLYNADLVTTVCPHICYLEKVVHGYAICGGMRTCHISSELERVAELQLLLLLIHSSSSEQKPESYQPYLRKSWAASRERRV